MNHWISVVPCTANTSVLSRDKSCDMVLLWYQITSKDLPIVCNGCGKKHNLHPALQCKKGGLIGGRHNDYQDDLGFSAGQAYSPSSVCNNPKVTKGQESDDR
eukprot:2450946-Ditylum_brightwellii.AAC.1